MEHAWSKTLLGIWILVAYVALSVCSLFILAGHMSHRGVSMSDCPYAIGQQSMCTMDFSAHIAAWQDMVRALIPTIVLLIVVSIFVVWRERNKDHLPVYVRRQRGRQRSPYLELFSRGILNPKIP